MSRLLVDATVLVYLVVDLDDETVEEVIIPSDVASSHTVGDIEWAATEREFDDVDEATRTAAHRIIDACFDRSTPWRLLVN